MIALKAEHKPEMEPRAAKGYAAEVLSDLKTGRLVGGTDQKSTRRRLVALSERLERLRALGGDYARVDFSPQAAQMLAALTVGDRLTA